jgi:hypothetical protein
MTEKEKRKVGTTEARLNAKPETLNAERQTLNFRHFKLKNTPSLSIPVKQRVCVLETAQIFIFEKN